MSESDREVLYITDVKAIQHKISTSSSEKAAAEDKVLQGQATIKNGTVEEANSAVVDLVTFNANPPSQLHSSISRMPNRLFTCRSPLLRDWSGTCIRPGSPSRRDGRTLRQHPSQTPALNMPQLPWPTLEPGLCTPVYAGASPGTGRTALLMPTGARRGRS